MRNRSPVGILLLVSLLLLLEAAAKASAGQVDDEALKRQAPKVFLDCQFCDFDYIRTEITFVNYVRDRKESQVHILITTQPTGSGGDEYTLAFIGEGDFKGTDDTLSYYSNSTSTDQEVRQGLVRVQKLG